MNTETLEEPQGYEQEFETVQIAHAQYGDIQFEAPIGMSDEEVKTEFGKLDLDLLLGLEQVNETEVGETQLEKLKEFENSAGAGRKNGKWYSHESLEGGTHTIAYGHKLTPEEAKSGFISINGKLVDYRQGLSQDHAEAVLKADTQWAQTHASASLKKIGMEDDEGKLQAITSLIYNVGSGSWGSSKAKKFLEAGNIEDFMHEAFSEEAGFVNINGEYSRGLARRRKEEAGLFAQANINEGSPFSKMISEVLNTINPISTAQAADDPKGLPLPTQAESDAATAAAEPPREATGAPVDLTTPLNTPEATGNPVDLTTPLNQPQVQPQEQGNFGTPPVKPTPPRVTRGPEITEPLPKTKDPMTPLLDKVSDTPPEPLKVGEVPTSDDILKLAKARNIVEVAKSTLRINENTPTGSEAVKGFMENALGVTMRESAEEIVKTKSWCAAWLFSTLTSAGLGRNKLANQMNSNDPYDFIRAHKYKEIGDPIWKTGDNNIKTNIKEGDVMVKIHTQEEIDDPKNGFRKGAVGGVSGHVGIVTKVASGRVYYISGNKDDRVKESFYTLADNDITIRRPTGIKNVPDDIVQDVLAEEEWGSIVGPIIRIFN
tara:strand:+ start:1105 stop:2910 length:1806 start_codon:yes stop_codon:yes gene_type:complete